LIDWLRFRVHRSAEMDYPTRKRWLSDEDGVLLMTRDLGVSVPSYSTSITLRPIDSLVEIDGNPSKFLQGHNICGTPDLLHTIKKFVYRLDRMGYRCWPKNWLAYTELHEVHINEMIDMDTRQNKVDFLTQLGRLAKTRHKSQRAWDGESVYFGSNKSKEYYWRIYDKEKELPKRGARTILDAADISSAIRAELVLKRAELLKLGLVDPKKWGPETSREVFMRYIDRIQVASGNVADSPIPPAGMSPKDLGIWYRWQAGQDLSVSVHRNTVLNWRRRFKALYDIDLALPPYQSGSNILDFGWFRVRNRTYWMGYSDIFRRRGSVETLREVA